MYNGQRCCSLKNIQRREEYTFLLLSKYMNDQQFLSFGWRIPFIASALLVWVGLYVFFCQISINYIYIE